MKNQRGFALLAVLWLVVALGALSAGIAAESRWGLAATAHRLAARTGYWAAEACLALAVARLDSTARAGGSLVPPPETRLAFANGARCDVASFDPAARVGTAWGDGRLNVNAAPDSLILTVPGFGDDALRVLRDARAWGAPIGSLDELLGRLPPTGRRALAAEYAAATAAVVFRSSSVVLVARGGTASDSAAARIEMQLAFAVRRVAVVRRRLT